MKYKVTLSFTVAVEAPDHDEARRLACEDFAEHFGCQPDMGFPEDFHKIHVHPEPDVHLIVDDERWRVSHQMLHCEHVVTAEDAIQRLARFEGTDIDVLWLDHDLGQNDDGPITVMPLVDWLCERAHEGFPIPVKIKIHTQNPVGAANIERALTKYGYDCQRVSLDGFHTGPQAHRLLDWSKP